MFRVEKTEYVNKTFRMPLALIQDLQCCNYALAHMEETEPLPDSGSKSC